MAIVIMVEPRPKLPKLRMYCRRGLTAVHTAPSLLLVSSQSCSFSIVVNSHLRS
jgi:hypothetical protein